MNYLSLSSIFFTYTFLQLFLGILVISFYKRTKTSTLLYIACCCFLHSLNYLVLLLRGHIPDSLGVIIPNLTSLLAYYAFYLALKSTNPNTPKPRFEWFVVVLAIFYSFILYTLYEYNQKQYIALIVGMVLGCSNLWILRTVIKDKNISNFFIHKVKLASYFIAISWIVRAILSIQLHISVAVENTQVNTMFFSVILLIVFVRIICLIGYELDKSIEFQQTLQRLNTSLFSLIKEKNEIMVFSNDLEMGMLNILNQLAKERDNETGNHIIRTQHFVRLIADHLEKSGRLEGKDHEERSLTLFKAAPLHDIGKVGIPDSILLKEGKHTPEEWEIMKTHTLIGERILESMNVDGVIRSDIIKAAIEIAGSHHENWDGTGYPRGLKGKEIPQSARIMSLADVYDALLSDRPYKKAWSHKETMEYIVSLKGTKFDPEIVDAFLALRGEFRHIRRQFKDV